MTLKENENKHNIYVWIASTYTAFSLLIHWNNAFSSYYLSFKAKFLKNFPISYLILCIKFPLEN